MSRFMDFLQGKGDAIRHVYVNMDQVCHITTDGLTGSVLTFAAVINGEPAYLCVNASPAEITIALVSTQKDSGND